MQPERRQRKTERPPLDRQFLRRGVRIIRVRIEQPHELEILVVIDAAQRHGPRPGNHHKRQPRIGGTRPVIDAREDLADLIGRDRGRASGWSRSSPPCATATCRASSLPSRSCRSSGFRTCRRSANAMCRAKPRANCPSLQPFDRPSRLAPALRDCGPQSYVLPKPPLRIVVSSSNGFGSC